MIAQATTAPAMIGHFRDFDCCCDAAATEPGNCRDFRGLRVPLQAVQVGA